MDGPPITTSRNLQGASCTTGGIIRGNAYGNVFNIADLHDIEAQAAAPVMGRVHLYDSCVDPANAKPKCGFKLKVTTSLGVVLTKLAEKDSPVRRKSLIHVFFRISLFNFLIGKNAKVFVYEDKLWNMKGRYSSAVEDEEPITWDFVNGEYILPLSVVS